jgi:hypothetical protein
LLKKSIPVMPGRPITALTLVFDALRSEPDSNRAVFLSVFWIPDRRGAYHRAALCADPLAASGITKETFFNILSALADVAAFVTCKRRCRARG